MRLRKETKELTHEFSYLEKWDGSLQQYFAMGYKEVK